MDQRSIEEARRSLGEIVDRARLADQPTEITRQGKPAAVIVGVDWYDAFMSVRPFTEWAKVVEELRQLRREAGLSAPDGVSRDG